MKVDYNLIGVTLLVIGVLAIVVEVALASLWSFRVSRRARELSERLASEQGKLGGDIERLRQAMAETETLWQPYARLLGWLRHPLTIAVMQSFARRWAATR